MAVYPATDDDAVTALADDIASDRGERVVASPGAGDDEPVLYVGPTDALAEPELLALQRRQLETGAPFGVVTGRTVAAAREFYRRTDAGGDGHCILLPTHRDEQPYAHDDDLRVLAGEDATVEALRDVHGEGLGSLSATQPGHVIHSYLADGYLCGFPADPSAATFDGLQPPCVDDGTRDCPLDGELLLAEELSPGHVFFNSCSSLVQGGPVDQPVSLGGALLANAVTVVGGYRAMSGHAAETALHYDLLRAGYDAGERVELLNRSAHALGLKRYPYVLFGEPESVAADARAPTYDYDVEGTDDGLRVRLADVDANVVDLRLDADLDGERVYVRNLTDRFADAPLFYAAFPEGDGVRVLLYTWGAIRVPEMTVEVSTTRERHEDRLLAHRAARNLAELDELGIADRKLGGQLENLRNHLGGETDEVTAEQYRANAYRDLRDRFGTVADLLEQAEDRLLARIDDLGEFKTSVYDERVYDADAGRLDEPCPNCGQPVFTETDAGAGGAPRRTYGLCPHCSKLFDVPTTRGDLSFPVVESDASLLPVADGRVPLTVSFSNPADVPMDVVVYPTAVLDTGDGRVDDDRFEPRRVETRLPTDGAVEAEFSFRTEGLQPGEYSLVTYVVGNLNLYTGRRKFFVEADA